jgi:hypothetical protein
MYFSLSEPVGTAVKWVKIPPNWEREIYVDLSLHPPKNRDSPPPASAILTQKIHYPGVGDGVPIANEITTRSIGKNAVFNPIELSRYCQSIEVDCGKNSGMLTISYKLIPDVPTYNPPPEDDLTIDPASIAEGIEAAASTIAQAVLTGEVQSQLGQLNPTSKVYQVPVWQNGATWNDHRIIDQDPTRTPFSITNLGTEKIKIWLGDGGDSYSNWTQAPYLTIINPGGTFESMDAQCAYSISLATKNNPGEVLVQHSNR